MNKEKILKILISDKMMIALLILMLVIVASILYLLKLSYWDLCQEFCKRAYNTEQAKTGSYGFGCYCYRTSEIEFPIQLPLTNITIPI